MDISEILAQQAVFVLSNGGSKKRLLQEISVKCEELSGVAKRDVFDALFERETLGSTNIGNGIAIPHGNIEGLAKLTAIFTLLRKPVDFDSSDSDPVDVVFTLLAPSGSETGHLKALAKIARTLRDANLIREIRQCESADAIYALLTQLNSVQAA